MAMIDMYSENKKVSLFRIKRNAVREEKRSPITCSLNRWIEFRFDVKRCRSRHGNG